MKMESKADDKVRLKWMQIWSSFQQQIVTLPPWAQDTLLDDINTAVKSRLVVLQKARASY
jgi:hypothetical protein